MGMALIAPSLLAKKEEAAACTVTNTETAGPFPTLNPATLVQSNIVGDRTGVAFTINITVKNVTNSCNPLQNVFVDIWHCDKDGNYSEYGGSGMQATDYTSKHFLRGRQTTDANGNVTFTSIFPGWYTGRATHIHVHIYTNTGTSLLITQIAFPEGTGTAVETVNAASGYGYTKGMTGYTYNASDNVFSDGTSNEMSVVTGTVAGGYTLNWEVFVSAPIDTGINSVSAESQFQIRQNYPNPCGDYTKIPVVLRQPSDVKVTVTDLQGKELGTQSAGNLGAGEQTLDLDLSKLTAGRYIYNVKITTLSGTYTQSKLLLKQ